MSDKKSIIHLNKVLSSQNEKIVNKHYIDIIIEEDIPVLCKNSDTRKERLMPFKVLYGNNNAFWQQAGSWEYYFTEEDFDKLKEKASAKPDSWDMKLPLDNSPVKNPVSEKKPEIKKTEEKGKPVPIIEKEKKVVAKKTAEAGYGNEYKAVIKMSSEEKIECLTKNKNRLNDLLVNRPRDKSEVTKALVDTTMDATLINHAVLEEAIRLGDDEAKKLTQDMVDFTHEMVKSSAQLITEDVFNNDLMNTLVEKSNGTIVQHMTRVYLNGIAFLSYYNNLVSSSSYIQKLRIAFTSKYASFYRKLLSHTSIDLITLEHVFLGGMRAIPPDLYFKWAVGFLIHDIGKASAVEYHEGEASYDRRIVIDHVKQGYKSVLNKTNYPVEASLITGYHHEYYGNPAGYGYFRMHLEQHKRLNPKSKQEYCISYELEPVTNFNVLAYFPAKVLEIIDVFDSVTDPNRTYRRPLTVDEALIMMREEFIERNPKIDIILFDIFELFIRDKGKDKK